MNEVIKETRRQKNERKEKENAYYVNRRMFFRSILANDAISDRNSSI